VKFTTCWPKASPVFCCKFEASEASRDGAACPIGTPPSSFSLMWSRPDVIGLFSINVVSFSRNVVLSGPLFSINVVWK
jgi:hypothetical protein